MSTVLEPTENDLEKESKQLRKTVDSLNTEVSFLKERIQWFERQLFGKKSEKFIDLNDKSSLYFPGLEPPKEELSSEPNDPPPKNRKQRKPKNDYSNGLVIPEGLPVEQTILDLPEEEKCCPETGEQMVKIGEEVTRQLGYRAGSYFVKETIRPKYAIPKREESGVFIHENPEGIIPRSKADESLLAEIITRKYADHQPLYRISEIFSRDNVQITRQLLSTWITRLGFILMPLYDLMLMQIKNSGVVYIDETPVKLQVKGKGKLQQGYMWVLVGGNGGDPPYRIYKYCENRNHEHAYDLLKGFFRSYAFRQIWSLREFI